MDEILRWCLGTMYQSLKGASFCTILHPKKNCPRECHFWGHTEPRKAIMMIGALVLPIEQIEECVVGVGVNE